MKRRILMTMLSVFCLTVFSCSKNDDARTNNLTETPIAKSQFDNTNFGIYKGVFVGSSGIIVIDINNSGALSAMLKVDGTTYNFTTTQTILQNQATSINFTSGANSFRFTVDSNGANPTITNLLINGHPNSAILVVKETSTAIVKMYEGSYSGGETGIFNAIIYNNLIKGLIRSTTYNANYTATGTVSNNQINTSGNTSGGSVFTGTLSGNNIAGQWSNANGTSGNWTGIRTY
jgi:hypothetical protein